MTIFFGGVAARLRPRPDDSALRMERRWRLAGMLLGYRMAAVVEGGNDGSER
jgi:hypothetical protein